MTTQYILQKLHLTNGQKEKFQKHFKLKMPLKIRLKANQLSNGDTDLFLTNRQINAIDRAKKLNKGLDLDFSHAQIVKQKSIEGGFLTALLPMVKTMAVPFAKKLAGPLLPFGFPPS